MLAAFLLSLKVKLHLVYDGKFTAYAKILFIKIKHFPRDKKKEDKKSTDKKENIKKGTQKTDEPSQKLSLSDNIYIIRDVSRVFLNRFAKHTHVKVAKIYIRVATDDAAQTAILYGAVSQAVACLIEVLDSVTNLDKIEKAEIDVEPDFLSEKTEAKINVTFSLRIISILDIQIRTLLRYIKAREMRTKGARSKTDKN